MDRGRRHFHRQRHLLVHQSRPEGPFAYGRLAASNPREFFHLLAQFYVASRMFGRVMTPPADLGRSTQNMLIVAGALRGRGAGLRVLDLG